MKNNPHLIQSVRACAAFVFLAALLVAIFSMSVVASQEKSPTKNDDDIAGKWEGTLGTGAVKLHLVITLDKKPDGTYSGNLNSIDQNVILPIETATAHGDAVHFEIKKVGGVYEGLRTTESTIQGTWTQTGVVPQTLALTRAGKSNNTNDAQGSPKPPAANAPAAHTPKPLTAPLDVVVPIAPTTFQADGKWHLVYELHITNLAHAECTLTRVEVVAADSTHKSLANFSAADLAPLITHPGQTSADATKIGPGSFAVVFLWITVNSRDDVPQAISDRVSTKVGDYPEALMVETPAIAVDTRPVATIGAPLHGEDWVAVNGPSNTSAHRRALLPVNGRAYISQRFAIDWVELAANGTTHTGDAADNKNYRAYGAEILSVADGIVTETKDGIPQNSPGANSRAVPITMETIGGNHVIVDIGESRFALYAHMQSGSLRVKVGDKVKRGDVLGLVGNSGNSTEPHLHFHICNANSPLGCEGLPYAFTSYESEEGEDKSDTSPSSGGPAPHRTKAEPVRHKLELPLEGAVVKFSQ
jgi:murein DD-endopeptidase MepM/ murein hydrolase activator NlpD